MSSVDTGIRSLEEVARRFGFELIQRQKFVDRQATYFVLRYPQNNQQIDFVLTNRFLMGLAETPSYRTSLENYLKPLSFRVRTAAWNAFYCISSRRADRTSMAH